MSGIKPWNGYFHPRRQWPACFLVSNYPSEAHNVPLCSHNSDLTHKVTRENNNCCNYRHREDQLKASNEADTSKKVKSWRAASSKGEGWQRVLSTAAPDAGMLNMPCLLRVLGLTKKKKKSEEEPKRENDSWEGDRWMWRHFRPPKWRFTQQCHRPELQLWRAKQQPVRSHSDSSCWSLTRYSSEIHNEALAAIDTDTVHGLRAIAAAIVVDMWHLWSFVLR